MTADNRSPNPHRPDLRAPGGGLDQHLERLAFLRKVQEVCPHVLRDLYDRAQSPESEEVDLREWSEDHNLPNDWILEVARRTYRIYSRPAEHVKRRERAWRMYERNQDRMNPPPFERADAEPPFTVLTWIGGLVLDRLEDFSYDSRRRSAFFPTPRPPLTFDGYDPEIHSTAEALKRLLEDFEAYAEAVQYEARSEGATDPVRRRARSSDDPDLHFEWLARWQCGGESQKEIGRDPGEGVSQKSQQAVQEGIARAADRIGLTRQSEL